MSAISQPHAVTLHSGHAVRVRQIRPDDKAALARAYARLSEPDLDGRAEFLDFASALGRGDIIAMSAPIRLLARASDAIAHIVRLPVIALRRALLADPEAAPAHGAAAERPDRAWS